MPQSHHDTGDQSGNVALAIAWSSCRRVVPAPRAVASVVCPPTMGDHPGATIVAGGHGPTSSIRQSGQGTPNVQSTPLRSRTVRRRAFPHSSVQSEGRTFRTGARLHELGRRVKQAAFNRQVLLANELVEVIFDAVPTSQNVPPSGTSAHAATSAGELQCACHRLASCHQRASNAASARRRP